MVKFIKLTNSYYDGLSSEFWVEVSKIDCIRKEAWENGKHITSSVYVAGGIDPFNLKETPEQILALIAGATQ